jgi:hypothetical protein
VNEISDEQRRLRLKELLMSEAWLEMAACIEDAEQQALAAMATANDPFLAAKAIGKWEATQMIRKWPRKVLELLDARIETQKLVEEREAYRANPPRRR